MRFWKYILAAIIGALIVSAFFCGKAMAVTYAGGTEQQRAFAQEVIESCSLDYAVIDARLDEIDLLIEDHHEPYWEHLDQFSDGVTAGLASPGNIWVHSIYEPGYDTYFGEIVAHEWCHQIWYSMSYEWREKWTARCLEGVNVGDFQEGWYTIPAENFAECARVALFDLRYYKNDYARTWLNYIEPAETRQFIAYWRWGLENHFTDLAAEDDELKAAAGYLSYGGTVVGYEDGSLGPYQPLLKRHVALICERAGLACSLSVDDYTPALRSDVRDSIPNLTWLDERWDEPVTRGQLVRLIWRAQ
jgi:hypothetical protein